MLLGPHVRRVSASPLSVACVAPHQVLADVPFRSDRRGRIVRAIPFIDTPYPKCHEPVKVRAIELHLARRELAIQYFQCADCGDVEAKLTSLKPFKLPRLAADGRASAPSVRDDFLVDR